MKPKSTSPTAWRSAATGLAFAAALGISSASAQSATNRDLDGDGIINALDPDIDNDAIPNGADRNVDGGKCKKGKFKGKYIGDHLRNDHLRELDIDDDGFPDDSARELDIDGDRRKDDAVSENDIDGDGRGDDHPNETDIDGDGKDDSADDDIDGDARGNGDDDDCDGDGKGRDRDDDDDGDGSRDDNDDDDDNDGVSDGDDGGPVTPLTSALTPADGLSGEAEASVELQYNLLGVVGAEIEVEGIPAGSYDFIVDGNRVGSLMVFTVKGKLRGKLEYEKQPERFGEQLLDFDIEGKAIEISQNGEVFFSGTAPTAPIAD